MPTCEASLLFRAYAPHADKLAWWAASYSHLVSGLHGGD